MNLKNISALLTILILLSGCSLIKSIKKSETVSYRDPSTQQSQNQDEKREVISTESHSRESSKRKKNPTPTTTENSKDVKDSPTIKPEAPKPLPTIKFSEMESANVRIPLNVNNPFPTSDELIIPLAELQNDFCYPYMGKVISQYGKRGRSNHTGVDIKAIPKDTIRAAFSGVVRMSKPYSGYGNVIVIRHYNGIETVYSHQVKNLVKANDVVRSGDPIGLAGRTGTATTEHLHFELRVASQPLNPNLLLDTDNQALRSDTLYFYKNGSSIAAYNRSESVRGVGINLADNGSGSESSISGGEGGNDNGNDSSATKSNNKSSSESTKYHTITQGDTLSKLARMYSTSIDKICKLNGIKPTKILSLKEKIRVA